MGRRIAVLFLLVFLPVALATAAEGKPRDKFIEAVNEKRDCRKDLTPTGHRLLEDARRHSRLMAREGFIFHTQAENLGDPRYRLVGEVVGVSDHWQFIFEALFDSPPHRRILRDCQYDLIAAGFFRPGDGTVWLTGRLYAKG